MLSFDSAAREMYSTETKLNPTQLLSKKSILYFDTHCIKDKPLIQMIYTAFWLGYIQN